MKTIMIVSAILTGILMFSTVVCGLWIRYTPEPVEDSSIVFHMVIAILTVIASAATIILSMTQALQNS